MKNLNNKEFEINKTTMRDLTSRELDQVAGASHCPTHSIIIIPIRNETATATIA